MADKNDILRYRALREDELNSSVLYRILAKSEKNPKISEVYRRLATTEGQHADVWAARLRAPGVIVLLPHLSWSTKSR